MNLGALANSRVIQCLLVALSSAAVVFGVSLVLGAEDEEKPAPPVLTLNVTRGPAGAQGVSPAGTTSPSAAAPVATRPAGATGGPGPAAGATSASSPAAGATTAPPSTAATATPQQATTYTVVAGDNPSVIAEKLRIPAAQRETWIQQLLTLNNTTATALQIGQTLRLPPISNPPAAAATATPPR